MLRTAFASRPAAFGRFDSTSCLDKPQPAIPGGLTLSSGLRLTDFSGDSTPSLHALRQGDKDVAMVIMRENESAMAKKVEDAHYLRLGV